MAFSIDVNTNSVILKLPFSGAIYIQPHDNLLVVTANERTTQQELEGVCQSLRANFGGKIFVNIPRSLHTQLHSPKDFPSNLIDNLEMPGLNRIRTVKPITLQQNIPAIPPGITIFDGEAARQLILQNTSQIIELMRLSKFSEEKIADYLSKGQEGIKVLMQGSHPVVLMENGIIIGMCNLSTIGDKIGYISDTLTQPDRIEAVTRLLYKRAAEVAIEKKLTEIKIIVPPNREPEFQGYGFVNSNASEDNFYNVSASFTRPPPGSQIRVAYEDFCRFIRNQQQWLNKFELTGSNLNNLAVHISTPHLDLYSIDCTRGDVDHYIELFGNAQARENYGTGKPLPPEKVRPIVTMWGDRWKANNPFSGFIIVEKGTHNFVGHIGMGSTNQPGVAEVACLELPEFWHHGYATEATSILVNRFIPEIVRRGYQLEGTFRTATISEKKKYPLESVRAQVWPDHIDAHKVLMRVGLEPEMQGNEKSVTLENGIAKCTYRVSLAQLQDRLRLESNQPGSLLVTAGYFAPLPTNPIVLTPLITAVPPVHTS